jgi:serine/threonine protein phosphatase PrpC
MRDTEKIVFATSVLGASHIRENKPCQDYSIAWQSKDSGSVVLIVCDGHGSDTYVRSDVGSRLAAQITLEAVKEFVPRKGHTPNPEWIVGQKGQVQAHEQVNY